LNEARRRSHTRNTGIECARVGDASGWCEWFMKGSEVHNLKDEELVVRLREAKEEAFNLRFRHATGELENTARIATARRDVARLLTVARERGIDVETELRR
jgi:large subunit ribosomal protein L29